MGKIMKELVETASSKLNVSIVLFFYFLSFFFFFFFSLFLFLFRLMMLIVFWVEGIEELLSSNCFFYIFHLSRAFGSLLASDEDCFESIAVWIARENNAALIMNWFWSLSDTRVPLLRTRDLLQILLSILHLFFPSTGARAEHVRDIV